MSEVDGGRYKRFGARPISLGLNLSQNPTLILDGETPEALNVDHDRGSVAAAGGSIKFNNQTAPRPGVRFGKTFDALLASLPTKSAPARAYGYIPYQENQDLGGVPASGTFSSQRYWHQQRGGEFDLQVSFRVPPNEKLYPLESPGQLTTSAGMTGVWDMKFTHNQALDEFFAVVQKGGDRFTPMSWALGVVNAGDLFDIDVGGGLNIFGVATTLYATRISNYALCFMWLDSSGAGQKEPVEMRYRLTAGSVWSDDGAHVGTGDGIYSTMAYRAVVIPHFVQPGVNYNVSLALTLDTGSSGTAFNTGTGEVTGVTWNDNGSIRAKVSEDYSGVSTYTYSQAAPGSATIYRYKGPTDSREYFTKYGIRHAGKDAMFLGLGFRYQPWSMAGFVPFGIDSAPLEVGGLRLTDQTIFGPTSTAYADWLNLDLINVGTNTKSLTYTLKIAHDPTQDLTGTKFEVSDEGLVGNTGFTGHVWGNETLRWPGISVIGKLPWSPYNVEWTGLGGLATPGFNPEALKSYRLVFAPSSGTGFSSTGSVGGLLSIDTYVAATAYGAATYSYHVTVEGGNAFNGASASFGPGVGYTNNGDFYALVRAFRWNQREVVVSDLRIYERVRTWSDIADFSLSHDLDPDDTNDPGFSDLVGHWPLTDGGGTALRETVSGNTGYFEPMGTTVAERGTGDKSLFISGEGEALMLDLSDDPKLETAVKDLLRNANTGVAVQITVRIPEASYGLAMRTTELGLTPAANTNVWRSRFAPSFIVWDIDKPTALTEDMRRNPNSAALATTSTNPVDGHFKRPPQLIDFGHQVHVDDTSATLTDDAFRFPLGFTLRTPVRHDFGRTAATAFDSNVAAWAAGVSRWSTSADWVGKEITFQVGFEPTGTDDNYKVYISGYPKQFLNPVAGDAPDAEFAYYTAAGMVHRRDILRSIITIGGAWRPTQAEIADGTVISRRTITHSELNARLILESIHVFAALPAGELPATSGAAITNGRGRITGGGSFPLAPLVETDIVRRIRALSVIKDKFYLNFPRGFIPPAGHPKDDADSLLYQLLVLGERKDELTELFNPGDKFQEVFLTSGIGVPATVQERYRLAVNRKVPYPSMGGIAARMTRHISYTAFADDVTERGLLVGNGQGFDPTNSTVEDARFTTEWFENVAGFGAHWKFRVFSAFGSGNAAQFWPQWTRGVKRSRKNAIRGIHALNKVIYVGAQGSVFEADDRWRPEGPSDTLTKSIALRGVIDKNDIVRPQATDRISFAATNVDLTSNTLKVTATLFDVVFDAWVKLDGVGGMRTIEWCGNESSNPAQNIGTHKMQWWNRINEGYPEFCVGATDTVSAAVLNRGVFVARSANAIPAGVWVHIRWILWLDGADDLQTPALFINGRPVTATITARSDGTNASPDWIDWTTILSASGYKLYLGAASDAVRLDDLPGMVSAITTASVYKLTPNYFAGRLHALGGSMAGVVVGRVTPDTTGFSRTLGFSPKAISYASISAVRFSVLQSSLSFYGVGHKCYDAGADQWGTIFSSPFISINHEMGPDDVEFSFADYGSETYVANGGRVGIIEDGEFRFAGVLPPQSLPALTLHRPPLYKHNDFTTTAGSGIDHRPDNDPIIAYASSTTTGTTKSSATITGKVYHFYNNGGMYLQQASDVSLRWTIDTFLCFKTMFRPDSVEGRIQLFARRDKLDAGYFVEIRDGFIYAGWYDPTQKKEVWVRTSKPIIRPGYVYYLYYRKFFPRGGLVSGHSGLYSGNNSNWVNSIFQASAATDDFAFDSLIVREFSRTTLDVAKFEGWTGYDAIFFDKDAASANYDYPVNDSSARACVSFTMADLDSLPTAPGNATPNLTGVVAWELPVSAASTGDVLLLNPATTLNFTLDHVGKLVRLRSNGGAFFYEDRVFRIVEFRTNQSVRLMGDDNVAPDFTGHPPVTNTFADVFVGTSLVKSDGYDSSVDVDRNDYVVELFGSSLQANPLNGITPFKGHAWSTAYKIVTAPSADASGNKVAFPQVFEDTATNLAANMIASAVEAGTDMFGVQGTNVPGDGTGLKDGVPVGELMVTPAFAHSAWLCTAYFDPNYAAFVGHGVAPIALDPTTLTVDQVATIASADPVWTHVAQTETGTRKLRLTAYDPDNAVESLPTDELEFVVNADLLTSPGGLPQLVLTRLPATHNKYRTINLKVYCSAAGGDTLFEIARIEDPFANSVVLDLDDLTLTGGTPLPLSDLDALLGSPPRAKYVATSQGRMCYANLYQQADGVAFSLAFNPEIVPVTSIFPVDSGDAGITGIRDLFGALVVFKRTAIVPFIFDENGEAVAQRIILGDGCVSNASIASLGDRLYFVSDRGPKVLSDGWEPFHVSRRIQAYFYDQAKRSSLPKIQGTLNRRRAQYVFTIESTAATEMRERFACEYDHPRDGVDTLRAELNAGHRFSYYDGPAISALGMAEAFDGGLFNVIGGTPEGFLVWMDRTDCRTVLAGALLEANGVPLWGDRTLAWTVSLAGDIDQELEGTMGMDLRWYLAGEFRRKCLFYGTQLYLSGPTQTAAAALTAAALPSGSTVSMGAQLHKWSTRNYDAGTPDLDKLTYYLDVTRTIKSTGLLSVDCFRNNSPTVEGTEDVLMTEAFSSEWIQQILQRCRSFRFLFRTQTPQVDQDFELLDVVVRYSETDVR